MIFCAKYEFIYLFSLKWDGGPTNMHLVKSFALDELSLNNDSNSLKHDVRV